uniref:Trichohyalin-plectin-homology domain-containing protein n=1 Tax=Spongospora subterranea TaxID=70186 RepID=A0A0H5QK81_9EUKA|eukprot:CRZ02032.1 hypothetical protein [Spongospora subterranea]
MRLAKEQSMSKYVDEQLRRQFRATCDELRQAGDKELIRKCERERRQQIETKKLYIAGERLQDVQWEELSNKTRQKQLDLEHNEAEKRRARNLSTYKEIDAQIETLQKKRELERAKVAEEAAAFQEELLRDRQKEAEERQAHALKAADQRLQIAEFNKEYAAKQEALNAVQDTEPIMQWGETPKQVQEDKHKLVVDMQQYLAYRQTEAQRHRQEERELDEIRNAELLKAAHKQDLLWHKEQLAKDKLMQEVIQSRRFQLLEKAEAQRRTAQAVEQSAGLAISLADGIGARRTESIANALKHQMEERRYQRETEKAARFYEAAETRIAEAEYQKRLQAEIRANAYREQDVSNPVK